MCDDIRRISYIYEISHLEPINSSIRAHCREALLGNVSRVIADTEVKSTKGDYSTTYSINLLVIEAEKFQELVYKEAMRLKNGY